MNSIIRVSCGVNQTTPGNPVLCCESLLDLLGELSSSQPDLIVFPHLSLCPPSGGSLNQNSTLAALCEDCLEQLLAATIRLPGCVVAGMLLNIGGMPCPVTAVSQGGEVVGLVCDAALLLPSYASCHGWKLLPHETVFQCGDLSFCISPGGIDALPGLLPKLADTGCGAVILPCYEPVTASSAARNAALLRALSAAYGIGLIVCNGGTGDTSSPLLYEGSASIYECGACLGSKRSALEPFFLVCDLDCDIVNACRRVQKPCFSEISLSVESHKKGLLRRISTTPFLPEDPAEADAYLDRIFDLQVQSLLARITNTGLNHLVLGVSGGLDSTLALLVCREALRRLELSPDHLVTITMPGFGTSDHTYFNALSLIEAMGGTNRDISIQASVLQHFEDIGHPAALHDITYENAQARERTQILFDLANSCRGLVIGTGDLSEAALGWCTFNGDQMASYNVNICLTKTMIRRLVIRLSRQMEEAVGAVLRDIAETPVSPELLPPDAKGNIQQKTEEILGSYDLHDFFLYYLLRYRFRPRKLFYYATVAFSRQLTQKEILDQLRLFLHRFFASQFKRSCSPDSASITEVNLSGWKMPSDCSPETFLSELSSLDFNGELS